MGVVLVVKIINGATVIQVYYDLAELLSLHSL